MKKMLAETNIFFMGTMSTEVGQLPALSYRERPFFQIKSDIPRRAKAVTPACSSMPKGVLIRIQSIPSVKTDPSENLLNRKMVG